VKHHAAALCSLTNAFGVIAATSYAPILSGSTG